MTSFSIIKNFEVFKYTLVLLAPWFCILHDKLDHSFVRQRSFLTRRSPNIHVYGSCYNAACYHSTAVDNRLTHRCAALIRMHDDVVYFASSPDGHH